MHFQIIANESITLNKKDLVSAILSKIEQQSDVDIKKDNQLSSRAMSTGFEISVKKLSKSF